MRKNPSRLLFKITYLILAMITVAAVATPPALAADLIPDSNLGALAMVISIAILMLALVIEIWRQTAKNAGPKFHEHMLAARKKPPTR